jgi:hypothetical protein
MKRPVKKNSYKKFIASVRKRSKALMKKREKEILAQE